MRMGKRGIIATVALALAFCWSAHAGGKSIHPKRGAKSTVLCQQHFQQSMQGKAGAALDLDGDGRDDLVVGAPYARHRGSSGAVLVYRAAENGFPKHPSHVLRGEGNLGWSIVPLGDITGDGCDWFAAGAINGSGERASLAGAVTIYKGGVRPQKVITVEGENALDRFGYALSSGDFNGDGIEDLVVGAPLHSPSPALYQQGAAYIYFGPAYDDEDKIKIEAGGEKRGIGFSFAAGDINDDGVDDLLLGAAGSLVGYYGGTLLRLAAEPETGPDLVFKCRDRGFASVIAVLWDVDGDGYNDVAVGANQAQIHDIDTGRLFILKGGSGYREGSLDAVPPPSDLLTTIVGEDNCGQFATAILPLENMKGDGIPGLAVSAVHADGSHWPMTGKIFLFDENALLLGATVDQAVEISGDARDMHLGTFLTLIRDRSWLAAGAPTEIANTGTVRLYDLTRAER